MRHQNSTWYVKVSGLSSFWPLPFALVLAALVQAHRLVCCLSPYFFLFFVSVFLLCSGLVSASLPWSGLVSAQRSAPGGALMIRSKVRV